MRMLWFIQMVCGGHVLSVDPNLDLKGGNFTIFGLNRLGDGECSLKVLSRWECLIKCSQITWGLDLVRQLDLQLIDFGVESQFASSLDLLKSSRHEISPSVHFTWEVWFGRFCLPLFHFLGPLLSTKLLPLSQREGGKLGKDIYLYKYIKISYFPPL